MELKPADIGVIIGRFQVPFIVGGHQTILTEVAKNHARVVVLLGCTTALGDKRDPLDFPTRQRMIQEVVPQSVVLPIMDCPGDDDAWSRGVDALIRTSFPLGSVIIYGGRNSFIPHYSGDYNTMEVPDSGHFPTGTDIRRDIARGVLTMQEHRVGAIYATLNNYPRAFMTVDVAITNGGEVLMGRKPGETRWRFPGGFVNPGEKLEAAARREAQEETGLSIDGLHYLGSTPIADFRYAGEDKITTAFFIAYKQFGRLEAGDDLTDVAWFERTPLPDQVVPSHHSLLEMFNAFPAADR